MGFVLTLHVVEKNMRSIEGRFFRMAMSAGR